MPVHQDYDVFDGTQLPLFEAGAERITRSGLSFHVRSADESDGQVLAEFFAHVTRDDLRFRFLSSVKEVGQDQLARLTHLDHRRVENFLAFDMVTGCLLASAMLAIEDDLDRAEVAIVIRSDFKNMGIGWSLLEHASEKASAMGVRTLQAIESHDNRAAIRVEHDMGFTSHAYPGNATLNLLEKSLPEVGTKAADPSAL